jgi:hypothetical protein
MTILILCRECEAAAPGGESNESKMHPLGLPAAVVNCVPVSTAMVDSALLLTAATTGEKFIYISITRYYL